ncbi:MAG: hypothetical protein GEU96_00320 [Propionibacteriales bacterium]|nr:hypothetical protein [Propionibacteriales bacterium]
MTALQRDGPYPAADVPSDHELTSGVAAARDSIRVGTWTAVSRISGVARVLLIAAVLGPTTLGNSFQLTNTLPNLIYYGFLAGSLCSSLLVPSLVGHLDRGDRLATARVSGGVLGLTLLVLVVLTPLAVVLVPQALRLAALGQGGTPAVDQADFARLLIVLMIPQVYGYAVIGVSAAVMNARHRFALTAAAPAIENCALIAVLVLVWTVYGTGDHAGAVPQSELLLLGLGSTAAVAIHAAVQFWGARRSRVSLRPLPGWRDAEVRGVVRRAIPAIAQSGLVALQVLTLLLIAVRIPGGTVAMQIALNFYALPIAVAATPVALSLLPRLSRLHQGDREGAFTDTFIRGTGLVLFITVPAACGYAVLARPIADVVAVGSMDTETATGLVAAALASVSAGIVGQSVFFLATQASYSRKDAVPPLLAMAVQATICLAVGSLSFGFDGTSTLVVLGSAYSLANLLGSVLLVTWLHRRLSPGSERLMPSVVRTLVGSVALSICAALTAAALSGADSGRAREVVVLICACLVGLVVFAVAQRLMRAPELSWIGATLRGRSRPPSSRLDAGA